jgi:hypothetical protein
MSTPTQGRPKRYANATDRDARPGIGQGSAHGKGSTPTASNSAWATASALSLYTGVTTELRLLSAGRTQTGVTGYSVGGLAERPQDRAILRDLEIKRLDDALR